MLRLIFLSLACAVLIGACGGDDSSSSPAAGSSSKSSSGPPELDSSKTYVATVDTSRGSFQITLDAKRAPKTGGSFKSLADKGFYDKLTFHRIVPGFVIQGGDPNGDGTGGPGYTTVDPPPDGTRYVEGVVAMAKRADEPAGTAGSQFFVVTGADIGLPPDYAVLGKVVSGMATVRKIGTLGDPQTEQPTRKVTIEKISIDET